MKKIAITIPCYNEAARLNICRFEEALAENLNLQLIFVNDGSLDHTREVLNKIKTNRCHILHHQKNQGKGESVRTGLNFSLKLPVDYVGYWDADLSTDLGEIIPISTYLDAHPMVLAVLGSRIMFLGKHIERSLLRHYLGRVFATVASLVLKLPVYDTQCGAKLFRNGPWLESTIASPFASRWVFDCEIIARIIVEANKTRTNAQDLVHEYPLEIWKHVGDSKVSAFDFARAFFAVLELQLKYGKAISENNTYSFAGENSVLKVAS